MNIFKILWDSLFIEQKTVEELISISSHIDAERRNPGLYIDSSEDETLIACLVVALQNEPSTNSIGVQLYNEINNLIVEKNNQSMNSDCNVKEYEELKTKLTSGTFKIRQTRAGFKFDLVASNGEFLACSEIYSSIDSCANGIKSVQKHTHAPIENQTDNNYKQIRNPKYEVYRDKVGEFRFRLKTSNGQIIIVSEGYLTLESCLATIERIKLASQSADLE